MTRSEYSASLALQETALRRKPQKVARKPPHTGWFARFFRFFNNR